MHQILTESGVFQGVSRMVYGGSTDTYWQIVSPGATGDFVRARDLGEGHSQITVKSVDRGDNLDRVEFDVDTPTSISTVVRSLTAQHGKPAGRISKIYYVYWLAGHNEHTTISCYSILGVSPEYPHVLVEVEATTRQVMLDLEAKVVSKFRKLRIPCERAPGSLFQMFFQGLRGDV